MDLKTLINLPQDDQEKYYGSTYLKGTYAGELQYISLMKFIGDGVVKFSVASSPTLAGRIGDLELEFDIPETGLYNSNSGPFFFFRKPERQTKKGICHHTTWIKMFASMFKSKVPAFAFKTNFNYSCSSFNDAFLSKQDFSLEEGTHLLGKKMQIGFALDRNFLLSHGIWGKSPTLWFRHVPIGEVEKNKLLIYSPIFFQEVVDRFPREGVKCEALFNVCPEKRTGEIFEKLKAASPF